MRAGSGIGAGPLHFQRSAWLSAAGRRLHHLPERVAPAAGAGFAGERCAGEPPRPDPDRPVLLRPGSAPGEAPGGSAGPGPGEAPAAPGQAGAAPVPVRGWGWGGWCCRAGAARDAGAPIPAGCSCPSCPGRSGGTRFRSGRRIRCWAGRPAAASGGEPGPRGARRSGGDSGPGCRCCFRGAGPAGRRPKAGERPASGAASGPAQAGGRPEGGGRQGEEHEPQGGEGGSPAAADASRAATAG